MGIITRGLGLGLGLVSQGYGSVPEAPEGYEGGQSTGRIEWTSMSFPRLKISPLAASVYRSGFDTRFITGKQFNDVLGSKVALRGIIYDRGLLSPTPVSGRVSGRQSRLSDVVGRMINEQHIDNVLVGATYNRDIRTKELTGIIFNKRLYKKILRGENLKELLKLIDMIEGPISLTELIELLNTIEGYEDKDS